MFVSICLTLVEQTNRLYFVVVSFYGMCLVPCGWSRSCYFGVMYFVIHTAHPPAGLLTECVCFCVCVVVGVRGAPWGEAGQSLPVAALGQVMAIQDTCLGSQPNLMVASLTLCPIVSSHLIHISSHLHSSMLNSL